MSEVNHIVLTEMQLELMIEQAATRGAMKALESVGLHDKDAGKDINDLRELIDSWRAMKVTIGQTVTRWVTISILTLLAIGALSYLGAVRRVIP